MINEIENGTVALISDKLESARKIGVQKGVQGLTQPAVYASVDEGRFERITQTKVKQFATLYVDLIFTSLKDQQARREGINLILEGCLQLLLLSDLGLTIQPLMPKRWRNTTTEELDKLGLISYSLELETSYILEKLETEAITDLLHVGLTYYLNIGTALADGSDTVSLPLVPKG